MPEQASLFLTQSSQDTWEDYLRSLRREDFPQWDYCILTASDDHQARSYRLQLARRKELGLLPPLDGCNACGLCAQQCKFNAIERIGE